MEYERVLLVTKAEKSEVCATYLQFGSKASPAVPYKTLSRMDAIHRHVIFEVLKFIPFENARNLLTTHKSWLKPLKAQLKKQRKAITVEIERLEETYQTLRIHQLQCKGVYVDLENQIKRNTGKIHHRQNIQSLHQHLQYIQNLRPAFNAASLNLAYVTTKVQALSQKIHAMKEILGIEQEKNAKERELDELKKIKMYHQVREKRMDLYQMILIGIVIFVGFMVFFI